MNDFLRGHLATLSVEERGPRLRALIAKACAFIDSPAPDDEPLLVANMERILAGRATKADTSGWRERVEAFTIIRDSGRELLPEIERDEVESLRSVLRATADKLHVVAIARRSKIIQKYWAKRLPNVTDDEARKNIRVILASTDFPPPELGAWEQDKTSLAKMHGQAILDAAGVAYVDPDIREQVAREGIS